MKRTKRAEGQTDRDTLISRDENQAMFDRIAKRYDLMNRLISLGLDRSWRRRALRTLAPRPGGRYLDLGAGTGDLSLGILASEPAAKVVGLDPAREMLAIGREKGIQRGVDGRVTFVVGDAQQLPFSDSRFDGIVLGFCIRNVEQRQRALEEIHRVLTPGGALVMLELTEPQHPVSRWLHRVHTGTVIPAAAHLLSLSSAYEYLVKSVRAFPTPDEFTIQIRAAGFADAAHVTLTLGTVTLFSGRKPYAEPL